VKREGKSGSRQENNAAGKAPHMLEEHLPYGGGKGVVWSGIWKKVRV